jgi:hypothetical protein
MFERLFGSRTPAPNAARTPGGPAANRQFVNKRVHRARRTSGRIVIRSVFWSPNSGTTLLDLDVGFANDLAPLDRLLRQIIGQFLPRASERRGTHGGELLLHLGIAQALVHDCIHSVENGCRRALRGEQSEPGRGQKRWLAEVAGAAPQSCASGARRTVLCIYGAVALRRRSWIATPSRLIAPIRPMTRARPSASFAATSHWPGLEHRRGEKDEQSCAKFPK